MTSVWGRGRPRRERPSIAPFAASSIAPPNSSPPSKSGDKLSDQPTGPSGAKLFANAPAAANTIANYSKDDLQRILKAVLEAWAPALTPAPAPVVTKVSREKLKACSLDVYRGKSHMDCYNFCQQYEDYFATAGATGPTQIPFAASFFWDQISFRWQ